MQLSSEHLYFVDELIVPFESRLGPPLETTFLLLSFDTESLPAF